MNQVPRNFVSHLRLAGITLAFTILGACASTPTLDRSPNRSEMADIVDKAEMNEVTPARLAERIELACQRLVHAYAVHRDRLDAAAFGDLFSEDATLSVLGSTFTGRAEIMQRLLDADPAVMSHHHMSTVLITAQSTDKASGVSYATVYIAPAAGAKPAEVEGFTAVGEYHDRFVKTSDGWKIAAREFVFKVRDTAVATP